MHKHKIKMAEKVMTVMLVMIMCTGVLTGCGRVGSAADEPSEAARNIEETAENAIEANENRSETVKNTVESAENTSENDSVNGSDHIEDEAANESPAAAIYFAKGVYQNYPPDDENASLDYFYVFYDGGAGYTEDAATGMGQPFACEQTEGSVRFSYGGEGDGWETFTVETIENKAVIGHFEDGKRLAFVYVPDADPDNFNAAEYMYGSGSAGGEAQPDDAGNSVLVAVFSATGTTKAVAEKIAKIENADFYEILPAVPYEEADLNYGDKNSRTTIEQTDPTARPEIGSESIDLSQYSRIYLGYPIWFGQEPRIMDTFVETYDLGEIVVIPFCTSGSSGISKSETDLKKNALNGQWLSGKRFAAGASEEEVAAWIEGLK